MKYKNIEMERMIDALKKHLERTDLIGYAAARNTRILQTESQEYYNRRDELVRKYGEEELDANGNPTGRVNLQISSPSFVEYSKEIEEWAFIEHEPDIFKIPASEVIGKLSGTDILAIDWMIEEDTNGDEDA